MTEKGTTEAKDENSLVKKAMTANSKTNVLLCDSTKFDTVYFCNCISMSDIDYIVTDIKPSDDFLLRCGDKVKFVY